MKEKNVDRQSMIMMEYDGKDDLIKSINKVMEDHPDVSTASNQKKGESVDVNDKLA